MNTRGAILLATAVVLTANVAGCGDLQEFKDDLRTIRDVLRQLRGKEPAPAPPAPPPAAEIPPAAAAGMTFSGNCVGKEETGYAENVRVEVAGGEVRAFEGRVDIPNRGSCSYRLADFAQTRRTPYVELSARSGSGCAVRMWQQGDRITLAPTDCAEKCTRGAFEYAWPVQYNTAGRCY
jgi:hypothetical protein